MVDLAKRVAPTDAAVLIRGENGTGKGVLARSIHAWSRRSSGPFVTVSAPSLNPGLLESELFGHAKGSYTGADRDVAGRIASAEGGTIFLDEVGDLPGELQPKLLRFLQEREYERVGETATRKADVRIVAATNRDLEVAVSSGAFRQDLLYRLNVFELTLPPLRLRSDIQELADRLLAFHSQRSGRPLSGFTPEARAALGRHSWPGNIRELRNAVERAAILAEGPEVGAADLPRSRLARAEPRVGVDRDRRPGPPRRSGGRAHPPRPRPVDEPRRGGPAPRDRPEHPLPEAEEARPLTRAIVQEADRGRANRTIGPLAPPDGRRRIRGNPIPVNRLRRPRHRRHGRCF